MKMHLLSIALVGALGLTGCAAHRSAEDKALLESATASATQAKESPAGAARSASQAARNASSGATSAAAAQQAEQ